MTRALLGLGGNLGDPRRQMALALQMIDARADTSVLAVSAAYRTPPWGKTDQPAFLNVCASLETDLTAGELLQACLDVERSLHRERGERWGPRTIDIDILDFGGLEVRSDDLVLPHPRMGERAFVLIPLRDIDPAHVIDGESVDTRLNSLDTAGIVRVTDDPDWWRSGV